MDGPCDACAEGPAPLIDPLLSFSERFSETEWGVEVATAGEIAFVAPRKARKWSGVAMALVFGVLVVALLIGTLMLGTAGTRRNLAESSAGGLALTPTAAPGAAASGSAAPSPSASLPAVAARPKPGAQLRNAFQARLDQANLGMHADFTMHLRAKTGVLTMTGGIDLATPDESASVRISSVPAIASPVTAALIEKDGVSYTRQDRLAWQRSSDQFQLPSSPLPASADLATLGYVGPQQVGGRTLYLYRGTTAALIEHGTLRGGYFSGVNLKNVRFEILVTADGVPVTVSIAADIRFTEKGVAVQGKIDFEFRISHFGEPMQIQAPMTGSATGG